jgi:hypothetical protein
MLVRCSSLRFHLVMDINALAAALTTAAST